MKKFQSENPELASKIFSMVESGLTFDEIGQKLSETTAEPKEEEDFPDEIKLISQPLAFRKPIPEDIDEIAHLMKYAYTSETLGAEAFRTGESVSLDTVRNLFQDESYHWLIIEAPNGKDIELDGVILGACCFTTDGVSRKNGSVEGNLGSIRLLAVLPRYRGLYLGLRLLRKVEELIFNEYNCVRSMFCVPSPRESLANWIERKGYQQVAELPYPVALGHSIRPEFSDSIHLMVFTASAEPEKE